MLTQGGIFLCVYYFSRIDLSCLSSTLLLTQSGKQTINLTYSSSTPQFCYFIIGVEEAGGIADTFDKKFLSQNISYVVINKLVKITEILTVGHFVGSEDHFQDVEIGSTLTGILVYGVSVKWVVVKLFVFGGH